MSDSDSSRDPLRDAVVPEMLEPSLIRCSVCDHDNFIEIPRLAKLLPPPLLLLVIVALVGAIPVTWWLTHDGPKTGLAALALVVLVGPLYTEWGSLLYWGGLRCRKCGHTSMYR